MMSARWATAQQGGWIGGGRRGRGRQVASGRGDGRAAAVNVPLSVFFFFIISYRLNKNRMFRVSKPFVNTLFLSSL